MARTVTISLKKQLKKHIVHGLNWLIYLRAVLRKAGANQHLVVDVPTQTMKLFGDDNELLSSYSVSTATNGVGEQNGSECTPRGQHSIWTKIGDDMPVNTVFVGRVPTGERYDPSLRAQHPNRDWILTRIIWLRGKEAGINRFGDVDTMHRYIYLHGAPDDVQMGVPGSHGCIRMRNADIIELYDRVKISTTVTING